MSSRLGGEGTHREVGIDSAEGIDVMIFEGPDVALCFVGLVIIWRHTLNGNILALMRSNGLDCSLSIRSNWGMMPRSMNHSWARM